MEDTRTTKWLVAAMAALTLLVAALAVCPEMTDGPKGGDMATAVESVLRGS